MHEPKATPRIAILMALLWWSDNGAKNTIESIDWQCDILTIVKDQEALGIFFLEVLTLVTSRL